MSEANQVSPGGGLKPPPTTVISQMLSTLETGDAEDKHCLSHECDVILECKICRNLFRVMNSFLNHKKVHCLQYVVSFTVPLPVSKTSEEKTDKDNSTTTTTTSTTNTEKAEVPAEAVSVKDSLKDPQKDIQKTDQTKKSSSPVKSPTKSKESEKESVSDKNQTKPPTTTVRVTASVESTDKMKLRSPRKTDSSISKKEEVKKEISTPKKGDSSVQKKDSSQPKKGDSSGHKQEESSSKKEEKSPKKDVALQKKGEASSHKKNDVSSTPKKNDISSQRREERSSRRGSSSRESSSRESSSQRKEESSKRERKEDASVKKGDSSSHKKDDSARRGSHKKDESSIPFRIDKDKKGDKESSKKEDSSVPFKKGEKNNSSQKKEEISIRSKRGDSTSLKKEDTSAAPKKVDSSSASKKEESSVQKKETASAGKQVDSANQKKTEVPPPSKKQKTEETGSSPTKKPTEESKEKVASAPPKSATTTVTPAPPTTKKTVTPTPPTTKTTVPPATKTTVTPTPPTAKTTVTPASPATKTTVTPASPATKTTVTPAPSTTKTTGTPAPPKTSTPAPTLAPPKTIPASSTPVTTTTTNKKADTQADQDKQPVLKKPEPISAENKADEPPILTPEKVSPSEPMEIPNRKQTDASDTLNPLIAGVLDAYQRYKDKNQEVNENVDKQKSNEAPTTNAKSATAEVAPMDLPLAELPDADKNDIEKQKEKAGDVSAALDDKDKTMNEDDLENEGYELRNRLRCPDCDLELTNMSKLAQHMSKHLADAKGHFVCPICQKETRLETFSELILHLRDPHFLKDKQLLPMWRNLMKNCWVDEKDMSATFPVIEAVKRSERGKDNELPEKNYKCPYCKKKPKILRYFSGLIGHLRSEHGLKRCQLQKMQAKLRKTSVVEVKHKKIKKKCMLFKCSFCFKTFTKKSSIKVHVKSCRKRTESTVKDKTTKKRRGRPKTFTKIVAFKTVGKKKSITDNSVSVSTASGEEHSERPSLATPLVGDQSTSISTAVNTPRLPSGPFSASNRDGNQDPNYAFSPTTNLIQPVKLETFWVSKAPGKPSECIKSTITNLEKLRTTPSKMFKSSELSKIGNFQCYSCNRYYSFRQHFERHVQLCNHNRKIEEISDFQTLRCLECNQSFSYLQHLKRHAAKHLGLDRFKCKLCNYSSYYWSDTKYHLASHKGVNLKHPEYYIQNVSSSENVALKPDNPNEWSPAKTWDTPRTVMKRVAEASPLVATGSSGPGVVKTLVLTEQDGKLKVVSDPNQIAKMVNQQGSPPRKRLRISADASQAPAIIKALPDIQKAVLSPGVKVEKRESTLMPGNLPSPTLSDPTPTSEVFEPAVDPDKEHISWVRKPLKDPDAQPFKWDDDDEGDGEGMANFTIVSTTSTTTSSAAPSSAAANITVQSSSVGNEKPGVNRPASGESSNTKSICETESKYNILADKPVPENFSEPPILTKEVPIVKSTSGKEKDDLQMPLISASNVAVSDASTSSQESVVTFMFNDNNELLMISPEASSGSSSSHTGGAHSSHSGVTQSSVTHSSVTHSSVTHSGTQHVMVSSKDFFSVPHPLSSSPSSSSVSTSTSTSTAMSPYGSPISPAKVMMMNKPKTHWDLQHKNTLRRLPNRGLVSTSNLSFPSASRRVTKTPNAPPVTPTAISSATSTPLQSPAAAPSSLSLSSPTGTSEK